MQASVHTFDPTTQTGSVIFDSGKVLPWSQPAWDDNGLRHLRIGQRVHVSVNPNNPEDPQAIVTRIWLHGIAS